MSVRISSPDTMHTSRKAAGLLLNENEPRADIMSSRLKVLNEMDVNSASNSSGEVGMPMPPKSVR